MLNDFESRKKIISGFSENEDVVNQVLCYTENHFCLVNDFSEDELFVDEWIYYSEESKLYSVDEIFQKYIIQFSFPVLENISKDPEYIKAVRTGKKPVFANSPHEYAYPDKIKLSVENTPAGRIPVIFCPERVDFENMLRIFLYKNEPKNIPSSQGACFVKGFNNWSRINKIRDNWISDGNNESDWQSYFSQTIVPQKNLYQDKFIILSDSPYSGVKAEKTGFSDERWKELSYIIRREHEICHFYTLKKYGYMANNMLDELIADFSGLVEAFGKYNTDLMMLFLGFENYPEIRPDGRFNNYFIKEELFPESIDIIKKLVYNSIPGIAEICEQQYSVSDIRAEKYKIIDYLCSQTLESLSI